MTEHATTSVKRDLSRKPPILPVKAENIPLAMREPPRWLGWRWTLNEKAKKWDKPPIDIKRDRDGSSTNSATWCDFDTALRAANSGFVDGIGFALGDGFCGVDFDDCLASGEIAPDVAAYVRRLNTYGEISPSLEGIKLVLRGKLPKGRRQNGKVEVYDSGRYFTVTGHRLDGCASDLAENDSELAALHQELIEAPQTESKHRRESGMEDRELALAALNGLSASRADNYHDWLLVGMALHATDAGLAAAWDTWSQASTKYTPDCCAAKWQSFNGSAVGLGSLVHWAQQDTGWTPPRRSSGKSRAHKLTDMGNAQRLVARHGADMRYCHPWRKWLAWDGKRWRLDDTAEAQRRAKDTARRIWDEIASRTDADGRKALAQFASKSEQRERLNSMLALAESEPGIPVLPAQLDADPWALNCTNGTLDLRTGTLRPHNRADLLTKLCAVEYLSDALCPLWDAFLETIFSKNGELTGFVQRLLGYSLTGLAREHVLPIFWGCGANGKSTLLETIMHVLGPDYTMKAAADLLLAKQGEAHPTERADLHGKRLVCAVETDDNRRLAESLVKELTGGDTIRARRMREDFWQFVPTHKLILATNHKPVVRGTDHAIWRRLRLVPFAVTISAHKQDKALGDKLRAEAPGILAWLVRGCLAWQQDGLGEPKAVQDATNDYKTEQDTIGVFIADCCLTGSQALRVRAGHLYAEHAKWCERTGEYAVTQRRFGDAMTERGFQREMSNGVWYIGIGLRSD